MKSKIYKNIFFLVVFLFVTTKLHANEFNFEAKNIEILNNGKTLKAQNQIKATSTDQMQITADQFVYDKEKNILDLLGNIEINDRINKVKIIGKKINYNRNKEIIFSDGSTKIFIDNQYTIVSENIFYNRKTNVVYSKYLTKLKDTFGNIFTLNEFSHSLLKKTFRGRLVKFTDYQQNHYYFNDIIVNLGTNKILGKDLKIDFNNSAFGDSRNNPRLVGTSAISDNKKTTVTKGKFTTCEKKNDDCPPWVISAEKIVHDKVKKTINYKNAWLKVYDTPIIYFPKFFHPDPTVDRQSGFLVPQINSSSLLGNSFKLPYFKVVSDNKDWTFSPEIFSDNNLILQTEYRQVNKNSKHSFDASFNNKNILNAKKINGTKSHFFSNSFFDFNMNSFDSSNLEINLQSTSDDNYLKVYKLQSPLISNVSTLNSYIKFDADRDDLLISSSVEIIEDLNKSETDRYEYIFPNYNFRKLINTKKDYNGTIYFDGNGFQKQYNTNIKESVLVNDLLFESDQFLLESGVKNNLNLIIKNVNTKSKNSPKYKGQTGNELLSSLQFKSSYPLIKENENSNSFFNPTVSLRYSPSNTKSMVNEDRRIDFNNIFSLDRIGAKDTVESGQSLTIGSEYKNLSKDGDEYFSLGLAQVLRDQENDDLPIKSTIGKKSSDIVGNINFNPNKFLDLKYNFSLDNNLDHSNYDSIKGQLSVNNFITEFHYLEENNLIGNQGFLSSKTSYAFNDNNSIGFETRRNIKTDLNEFYNLIYEYKNDCLVAALEYNKEYYSDSADLKPNEHLFFSITIVPLGKINSPTLK